MTADLWVPGLLILALGSAVGWWLTRRSTSPGRSAGDGPKAPPSEGSLELADLGHRRDELYARLRDPDLDEDQRKSLELEAAGVLKKIDEVEAGDEAGPPKSGASLQPAATAAGSTPRTLLTGFLFGGGTVALIALLVFWAGRDAKPRETEAAGTAGAEQPHPVGDLPPEVAAEVEELQARIAAAPNDLAARKRLALLFLGTDQYVPAYEQAAAILAVAPDDIDSLYVQGVVRMTMGQDQAAMERLDRVLALFPDHVRAMTVQGLIFARRGDRDRAEAVWNRALEIGGPQPQIENLIAMLDAQGSGQLPAGHPPTAEPAQAGAAPDSYTVRVDAEVIPGFSQTGVVFVALRAAEGAPPVAVRRIDQPTFPMLVAIGPGDMMMATGEAELPEAGWVSVRLDQDGSASTKGDDDLEGGIRMKRGETAAIVLE